MHLRSHPIGLLCFLSVKYDVLGAGCEIQDKAVQVITPDGKITKFSYDKQGRKIAAIFPDGTMNFYSYNPRGDLTAIIDGLGNNIQFQYDGNGRLIKSLGQSAGWLLKQDSTPKVGFLPEEIHYKYDEADRLVSKEQIIIDDSVAEGKYVTEYSYDDFDRINLKRTLRKQGSKTIEIIDEVSYKYYPILSPTLVAEISNKYISLKFSYETQPPYALIGYGQEPTVLGASLGVESHNYRITPDQNGPVALINREGAQILRQTYDPAGRLMSSKGSFNTASNLVTLTYDSLGRRTGISHTNGLIGVYGYDDLDRVNSISWTGINPIVSSAITYSNEGLISQIVRENGTFNFRYSPVNQLSRIDYSGSEALSSTYVGVYLNYDKAGNITSYGSRNFTNFKNFTTQIGSGHYNPSADGFGRLQTVTGLGTNRDFQYYPNGQLKKFRYIGNSGETLQTADYYYDGLGRRIAKVVNTTGDITTTITYSHLGSEDKVLFGKYKKGTSSEETLYVDGQGIDDHLFEISSESGVKAYKKDHLGSVLNSAAIGGKSVYGLFGENLGAGVSVFAYTEPVTYGFTGREYDNETGFYYYRARYYDPTTARFLTKDPLGPHQGGDINPYRYAMNNPVNFTDPTGLRFADNAGVLPLLFEMNNPELNSTLMRLQNSPVIINLQNVSNLTNSQGETLAGISRMGSLSNGLVNVDINLGAHLNRPDGLREYIDTSIHEITHVDNALSNRFQQNNLFDFEEGFTINRTSNMMGRGGLQCR